MKELTLVEFQKKLKKELEKIERLTRRCDFGNHRLNMCIFADNGYIDAFSVEGDYKSFDIFKQNRDSKWDNRF